MGADIGANIKRNVTGLQETLILSLRVALESTKEINREIDILAKLEPLIKAVAADLGNFSRAEAAPHAGYQARGGAGQSNFLFGRKHNLSVVPAR